MLLEGRRLLITGVLDTRSIAFHVAEQALGAGAEVVLMSGRRRAQVHEDARLIGQPSFIFEAGSGLVIDGEGGPGRRADVAIAGSRIVAVGEKLGPARREIDAGGPISKPADPRHRRRDGADRLCPRGLP